MLKTYRVEFSGSIPEKAEEMWWSGEITAVSKVQAIAVAAAQATQAGKIITGDSEGADGTWVYAEIVK